MRALAEVFSVDHPVPLPLIRMQDSVMAGAIVGAYLYDKPGVIMIAFLAMVTGAFVGTRGHPVFLLSRTVWEWVDSESAGSEGLYPDREVGNKPLATKPGTRVRVDQGVAAILLGVGTLLIAIGEPDWGWRLVLVQGALSLASLFGFCANCAIHHQLSRFVRRRARTGGTSG